VEFISLLKRGEINLFKDEEETETWGPVMGEFRGRGNYSL